MDQIAHWEILALRPRADRPQPIVGMLAAFVGRSHYVPLVIGLDYAFVEQAGLYQQCLMQVVRRAHQLGLSQIEMGLGADCEKMRFGAQRIAGWSYVQAEDHYAADAIHQVVGQLAAGGS